MTGTEHARPSVDAVGAGELWGWTTRSRVLVAAIVLSASIARRKRRGRLPEAVDAARRRPEHRTAAGASSWRLPRLGPALVKRIVAERERKPFRSLDDFDARVRGIGPGHRPPALLRFGTVEVRVPATGRSPLAGPYPDRD